MTIRQTLLSTGAFGGMTANEQRLGRFIRDGEGHPAPTPAPAPAPAEPQGGTDDPFASAFASLTTEEEGTPAAGESAPAAPADGTPEGTPAGGEAPAGDDGNPAAPAGETPPGETPAGEGGEGSAPAAAPAAGAQDGQTADDILNRLAGLINQPAAPQPQGEQPAPTPAAEPAPIYTADEQAAINTYHENWPDVARGEQLVRRQEYDALMRFMFGEMATHVAPLFEQVRAISNTLHVGELKQQVPDYSENLEQDVIAWIDTQPSYLQAGMKQVMQSGTSDEVADLFGRYRADTGTAPAPAAPAPAPASAAAPAPAVAPVPAPKTELSSAAIQAAESLAPVSGDRTQVPQGEDTQDYDSAFQRYAATMGT